MRIAENVEMLEVKSENGVMYPVLLWDENDIVLVDTGFPMQIELIRTEIERAGFSPDKITKIIFTHQDIDHIGCIKEIAAESPAVFVMAHEEEAPYIQGDSTPVKLAKLGTNIENADEATKKWYDQLKTAFENRYTKINHLLKDGEVLPICGGIEIIHTPGHTPGHICLYLKSGQVLVTGDALNIIYGELMGANPQFTLDIPLSRQSIKKLMDRDTKLIVTYHGGLYSGNINKALAGLSN